MSDMWDRLSEQARVVMRLALAESEQLGHGYVGDEHVLLGLLRDQANPASSLLKGHGLDLASARAELQRLAAAGLMPRSCADDAGVLRAVGIDVEAVRQRLVTAFGAEAVGAAVWRASRRPWWRGGGRRRTPLCGPPFFAKRCSGARVPTLRLSWMSATAPRSPWSANDWRLSYQVPRQSEPFVS